MNKSRQFLADLNYPSGDAFARPSSGREFAYGGHYGIELSSVNNFRILESLLQEACTHELMIDRVVECRGIFRLPDAEIRQMSQLCSDQGIGLIMSVGPRATYDVGGFSRSANGSRIGYRLRGMENIAHALNDVLRAVELGVRGFLVYDEGCLLALSALRERGSIPQETIFKLSVHCGCSNPIAAKLFASIGANTINLIPDLDISMLAAFRETIQIPIDLFTDTSADAGGILRTYDVPEFIRVASPVFLKCGPISQAHPNHLPTASELTERIKQTVCVVEMIRRSNYNFLAVARNEPTKAIPFASKK